MLADAAPFLILKSQHVGSQWLTIEFNRLPGCSLLFEAEDCGDPFGDNIDDLVVGYLQRCTCPRRCLGCTLMQHNFERQVGCGAAQRAIGLSFGFQTNLQHPQGLDMLEMQQVERIVRAAPRLAIVVHARTNFVKMAFSAIRSGCPGQLNHIFAGNRSAHTSLSPHLKRSSIRVSPPFLLQYTIERARAQATLRRFALAMAKLSTRGKVVHEILYEVMQEDGADAESRLLLRAIGAQPTSVPRSARRLAASGTAVLHTLANREPIVSTSVKAGTEDLSLSLSNFKEIVAFFTAAAARLPPLGCLHAMLLDKKAGEARHWSTCEAALLELQPNETAFHPQYTSTSNKFHDAVTC